LEEKGKFHYGSGAKISEWAGVGRCDITDTFYLVGNSNQQILAGEKEKHLLFSLVRGIFISHWNLPSIPPVYHLAHPVLSILTSV